MNIAVLIARGGSTRLPRKNVRPFCGHPLIAWTITAALCSETVDAVYVSTDDDEIDAVAKKYGAYVIRRPEWTNPNEVAGNVPFEHAIKTLQERYGPDFNEVVTILPTVPLIKPEDIDNLVRRRREIGADRISPIIVNRETCLYKLLSKNHASLAIFDKGYKYGTQIGGIVATTPECYLAFNSEVSSLLDVFLNDPNNWSSKEYYWVPAEYWQYADTDTKEEFEFAEIVMEHYILKGKGIDVYREYKERWMNSYETPEIKVKTLEEKLSEKFSNINQM